MESTVLVKVTRKYQVTIPKNVRRAAKIKIGDKLKVVEKDDKIVLSKPTNEKSLLDLAGCWKGYPRDSEELMKEIRKAWSTWKI